MYLVQQLVTHRVEADAPAGILRLRDDGGAVGLDLRDRVRQVPRMRDRPPFAAVVAARDLAGALEQVPDERAGREAIPVVPLPAVGVRGGAEEQRRVCHSTRDHDVGAAVERVHDRVRAQIRGCEQRLTGKVVEVGARLRIRQRRARVSQLREPGFEVVAEDGRDPEP